MNENIDLTKILKDCPRGWNFYTSVFGDVKFSEVDNNHVSIERVGKIIQIASEGRLYNCSEGECIIFPSRKQRDWNKFVAPWYKKDRFDPKTLKPFDRVICKGGIDIWRCNFFSSYEEKARSCPNVCVSGSYARCIPYNDDTKHLVGTTDEAPEFYKYWEDDCKHNTEDPF